MKKSYECNSLSRLCERCPKLDRDKPDDNTSNNNNNNNNKNNNNNNNNNNVNSRDPGQNNNNVNRFGDKFTWKYAGPSDFDAIKEYQSRTWKFVTYVFVYLQTRKNCTTFFILL